MALARGRMRPVALKRRIEDVRKTGYADVAITVLASIYPLTSATAAQIYGQKVTEMKLMLVPSGIEVSEGMGVCVEVPVEAYPDYCVEGVPEVWRTHTRAHLARIPAHERAAQSEV